METSPPPTGGARSRNRRGQGERLRAEIVDAALALLDELADDQALSMRAVARHVGIAATSVYLHFADRDALVLAALERCQHDLLRAAEAAEDDAGDDPVARLRARTMLQGTWAYEHAGLYKVLHESAVNRSSEIPFRRRLGDGTTLAVRRCMDAGRAPAGDAAEVALDLRSAVHGAVSLRLNIPDHPWPPLAEQVDRFLTRLVGVEL
ncbi:TetR/AcrR family transcriptional regulator [Actinomadura atramentaria]|uniref:TetR/AcrR family transcriptional regulator n=1 Tax=Actinomadura atramentaria TaxID=1990 RepID=UPI00196A17D2|nr:TetR/AcrR family transcriptional regulator [Actinomadura atramentaria]